MAEHHFVTLGAFPFKATGITIGGQQRTINTNANALSRRPVQTSDYISAFLVIAIEGYLQGVDTQSETAVDHLLRLRHNLKTEVRKDSNLLVIDWLGEGSLETYNVLKNDDFALTLGWTVQEIHRIDFAVTLNCEET